MQIITNFYISCKKHPLWVFAFFGIVFLSLGYVVKYNMESEWCSEILIWLASILLSGGVFAVIVKSAQFSEIFENSLRNIIYQKEHLEKREDLEDIWLNVTSAFSRQKFPNISDSLHKNIKKYFLPVDHDYYYDSTKISLDIEIDPEDDEYLIVKEKQKTYIITDDDQLNICYSFTNGIPHDMSCKENTTYVLKSLRVNGKASETGQVLKITQEGELLLVKSEIPLCGYNKYTIEREEIKKYKLALNRNKRQLASWLYNNCSLTLTYPKELTVEFNDFGVLQKWKVESDTSGKLYNKLEAEYKGLIYKNQGFLLHFNKINT